MGMFVIEKIPPIDPSMCSHILLFLQISPIPSIGSNAPLIVVPRVATIEKIFLFNFEHFVIVFFRYSKSIEPLLSVFTLIRLFSWRPIIFAHFINEECASSLMMNAASGSELSPALSLAAIRAFKLLNVPPLAAIPPE